jgi:peptidoglycan hydrolase-like protein with peptidoglycan-binding domain
MNADDKLCYIVGMKMKIGRVVLAATLLALVAPTTSVVHAQISCTNYNYTLRVGSRDSSTGGAVSSLQQFLTTYYASQLVTGYFGVGTQKNVKQFQADHGVSQTGMVGPITRSLINQLCQNGTQATSTTTSSTESHSTQAVGWVRQNQSTSTNSNTAATVNTVPYIDSITPSQGPVGTTISISGRNFNDSNFIHFGPRLGVIVNSGAWGNNGNKLQYTVPASASICDIIDRLGSYMCTAPDELIVPGTYEIWVHNSYGDSNSIYFTVTSTSTTTTTTQ